MISEISPHTIRFNVLRVVTRCIKESGPTKSGPTTTRKVTTAANAGGFNRGFGKERNGP
ncbi:hypothetical protein PT2222_230155 [Paraburkholderia tropica]